MSTHAAVVTVAPRAPLEIRQVPTPRPKTNEVRVRVEWTTSGPLDLHKADGGLLVSHPEVLGGGIAGSVVHVGEDVKHLSLGDKVSLSSHFLRLMRLILCRSLATDGDHKRRKRIRSTR